MTAGRAGFGVVEALVALALAAVAFGALASATQVATRALRRAASRQAATAAATARLETLRAGARASGHDVLAGTPAVTRVWRHVPGRGRPDGLRVDTECDGSRVTLESAVWP
jgi:type II secretory pathway pseudopilin PulG